MTEEHERQSEAAEGAWPAPVPASAPAPAAKPRVVALLNQKGGVGKTTSTVNLGAALARFGQRVLLVDLDPQSNLSLHFGVESGPEQRTVRDLLLDPSCGVADCVQQARPGLDFIPAVTELALVEGELAQQEGMQSVLRSKLEQVHGNYDVVLLDCPPSLGVLSVNALTAADEVFVPMQAHYLPLRGLEKLLQTVHLVSQSLNPSIRVTGILLCMHDGSSSHARAVISEIEQQLEQFRAADVPWSAARVLHPPVRRNIKLAEAPSFGQTIFDYAPRCPGAGDYRDIVRALLERWGLPHGEFESGARRRSRSADAGAPAPRGRRRRGARKAKAGARKAKAGAGRPKRSPARKAAKPKAGRRPKRAAAAATKRSTRKPAARATKRTAPARAGAGRPSPKAVRGGARRGPARSSTIRSGGLSL
jgi:chromosome partitioning protein